MTSVITSYPFTVDRSPSGTDNNISIPILDTSNLNYDYITDDGFGTVLAAHSLGNVTSIDTVNYFSISFSTNSNYFCDIHSISFEVGKGGSSDPRGYIIYSNQDNYIVPIANVQLPTGSKQSPNPTTVNLSFNNITEFNLRIYVYAPLSGNSVDFRNFAINGSVYYTEPPSPTCFPAGTPIQTDQGVTAIEQLVPGEHTLRGKSIIAITQTRPLQKHVVCFSQSSLGRNVPSQQTVCSKEHKVLYKGEMIKARDLADMCKNVKKVSYNGETLYNVLLEKHGKMLVNNMICETLHPENIAAKFAKMENSPEKRMLTREMSHVFSKTHSTKI